MSSHRGARHPMHPTSSIHPNNPNNPNNPVDPVDPAGPAGPAGPVGPVDPTSPDGTGRGGPGRGARAHAGEDDGVALLFVVMAVLILASLSVLALGAVVVQAKPNQFQRKEVQTINAAEAGLDVALAAIRNATYVEGLTTYGDRSRLPCWSPFTGQVGDPRGGVLAYTVTIQYFSTDPSNQSAAWRAANALACGTNIGTPITPTHAFVVSAGSGAVLPGRAPAVGNRTLQSVYTFSATTPNVAGGLIRDTATTAGGACYAATGTTTGSTIELATCDVLSGRQQWAFTDQNQLVLTSTRNSDNTGGMCVSADPASAAPQNATLQPCVTTVDYKQRWGLNVTRPPHFDGHHSGTYSSRWCLVVASAHTLGSKLRISADTSATTEVCDSNDGGAYPAPAVGAGSAGTTTPNLSEVDDKPLQWVNYKEFGRCMDIPGWTVTNPLQVYPCKQDPMYATVPAASVGWNQVFTWNSLSKQMQIRRGTGSNQPYDATKPAYCMRSPNTEGGNVYVSDLCSTIAAGNLGRYRWTMNRETGQRETSYTIVDEAGRCLSLGAANPNGYSMVSTATCTGGANQKWNAPPSFGTASVSDTAEVPDH